MGPYDYANFQAPQANPSPAAYGPYDVGIHPYLMQLATHLAQMGIQRRQTALAAERQRHDIENEDRLRKIAEARYLGTVQEPGGESTQRVAPQISESPEGLPTAGIARPSFTTKPVITPPLEQQRIDAMNAIAQGRLGVQQEGMENLENYRQEELDFLRKRLDLLREKAKNQTHPGEITPSIRASKKAQLYNEFKAGGSMGLQEPSSQELAGVQALNEMSASDIRAWLSRHPDAPANVRGYAQIIVPYAEP